MAGFIIVCVFIGIQTIVLAVILLFIRSEIKGLREQMEKENDEILKRLDPVTGYFENKREFTQGGLNLDAVELPKDQVEKLIQY